MKTETLETTAAQPDGVKPLVGQGERPTGEVQSSKFKGQRVRRIAPRKGRTFAVVNVRFLLSEVECAQLNELVALLNESRTDERAWTPDSVLMVAAQVERGNWLRNERAAKVLRESEVGT